MRLIDADAYIAEFEQMPMVQDAIRKSLEHMPTIEERKKGRWNRYYRMHSGDTFVCNRCGSCFVVLQGEDKMNFCPNCGADMRGEGGEP